MRYKPERALTRTVSLAHRNMRLVVEMRYKPEMALTLCLYRLPLFISYRVEMRYKPESKVLVFVTRKMIKEGGADAFLDLN